MMTSNELYYVDHTLPQRIEKFFAKFLVHTKGTHAGKPFCLLPWQKEFIFELFGTYDKATKLRRYRNGLLLIPRKNGKSTLLAGLCLYFLLFGDSHGEVYAVANSRDQARIIFQTACDFVASSKQLSKRIKIYKNSLYEQKTRSIFRVLSRDATTALGLNASFVVFDELLGAPDDTLYNSMVTSMGARREPLMLSISTAGFSKASFLYQLVEHGQQVNAGIVKDDTFYCKIYGLSDSDDWTQETTWYKCNPSLGHTISIEFFRSEFQRAKEFPRFEAAFKTLYLNAWLDSQKGWIGDAQWQACEDPTLNLNQFNGEQCYVGLDLSSTTDLTALALCFYKEEKYNVFCYTFCPEDNIQSRARKDKVPYPLWSDQGWLIKTSGNVVDYDYILKKLGEVGEAHKIVNVALDRWNSSYLATKIMEMGLEVLSFGQGYASMSPATKGLETLILSKRLCHNNNPVVRWAFSNVTLAVDAAGNVKPNKAKSKDRIDPVVAIAMAVESCAKANHESGMVQVSWL